MPVKLTESGKPLAKSVEQPAPQPAAQTGASTGIVDQLLMDANSVPQASPPTQPAVATANVGKLEKDGGMTVETTEHVKVWLQAPAGYTGPYGKVTYGMAATVNTGNYENLRPFVQIEVPFIPGQQDAAYAYAEDWADTRISNIINATKAQISGA